jgi:hypothetical protein
MAKKSFQDSMDWDDIMFDKQPNANGTASEWDNFSVPNFTTSDSMNNNDKPKKSNGTRESSNKKDATQKESRKSSKKTSTKTRHTDSPAEEDDDDGKSTTIRKLSSSGTQANTTTTTTSSKSKNSSPKRGERRQHSMKRHDDDNNNTDSDSSDDGKSKMSTKPKQEASAKDKEPIHHSPSASKRKERKSEPIEKESKTKRETSTKQAHEKRHGENESKRGKGRSSDETSVIRRDKSPTSRGERSRISNDDDTVQTKDTQKMKSKKEKTRKSDGNRDGDDETTSGPSSQQRRDASTRKGRSTTIDDKLDEQSHSTRDSSRVRRSRNGQLNAEQLSQSRQRAVQRMEARNNWRESQRKSNAATAATSEPSSEDNHPIDTRRASLLDQSRRGPIRSFRCNYDDDDDDDFSVLSGMTSSSFTVDDTLDAPFVAKNIKSSVSVVANHPTGGGNRGSGGYLPNSLNNTNTIDTGSFQKKERRPSAFGTGYERIMALNSLKNDLDNDSDDEGSVYTLPSGLSRAAGTQFEIDRSGRGSASTRRPSLSTTLTVPCINGIDDSDNDDDLYSKSSDRRGSMSSKELDPSAKERRGSMSSRNVDYESDSNNKKAGANYDSTVEDMLKSRRLRGARGDAAKKKEEKKSVKKTRGLSISMLTNLVQSNNKSTPETSATGSTPHRRASTVL